MFRRRGKFKLFESLMDDKSYKPNLNNYWANTSRNLLGYKFLLLKTSTFFFKLIKQVLVKDNTTALE